MSSLECSNHTRDDTDDCSVDRRPRPRVSIGFAVYNGEREIRRALESLLNQTFTDFELIISDNCSTDATASICQEYARRDPRIRYIRQERNIGGSRNFKFVFEQATGKYFFFAAWDDFWNHDYIEEAVATLEANPSASCAFGLVEFSGHEHPCKRYQPPYGLDQKSRFARVVSYYSRRRLAHRMPDHLLYSFIRRDSLEDFEWELVGCFERKLVLHLILKGPVADNSNMVYNVEYWPRDRDNLSKLYGVPLSEFNRLKKVERTAAFCELRRFCSWWQVLMLVPLYLWHQQHDVKAAYWLAKKLGCIAPLRSLKRRLSLSLAQNGAVQQVVD